ncbi:MAG: SpoIIE family protein phosphatase [Limnochordaceae bacterium]|nr:SpoIIE family protein phosphatase [Limnochordaceae bacterium]
MRHVAGPALAMLAGVLLSSARVGNLGPFALAFFFSTLETGAVLSAAAAVGTVAGAALFAPAHGPVVLAAVALGWALAGPKGSYRLRRRRHLLAAPAVMAARLVAGGLGIGQAPLWWIETVAEAMAAAALAHLWSPVAAFLGGGGSAAGPVGGAAAGADGGSADGAVAGAATRGQSAGLVERAAGLVTAGAALLVGLVPIGVGPVHLAAVAGPLLTLVTTASAGPSLGVALAVVSGFLMAVASPRWLLFALAQAAGALGAAALSGGRKEWAALSMAGVTAAAGLAASSAEWVAWALGHTLAGALLYLIMPGAWLVALERRGREFGLPATPDGGVAGAGAMAATGPPGVLVAEWAHRRALEGVESAAGIVEALRATYETAASAMDGTARADGPGYVGKVQERACRQCPSFAHCWESHANASFWDVLAFLERAEQRGEAVESDMPAELRRRCIQPFRLAAAVSDTAALMAAFKRARKGAETESRRLMSEVGAAAGMLRRLRAHLEESGLPLDVPAASRLMRHMARLGIPYREAVVAGAGCRREVVVRLREPCGAPHSCSRRVLRAAQESEGIPLAVVDEHCRHGPAPAGGRRDEAGCEVRLVPRAAWQLDVAFTSRTRWDQNSSGDTFRRVQLAPGLVAVVLSDGMGSGPEAARESTGAVRLAEAALVAGFDAGQAIQFANAVLLARSPDERFATLDLAVFDLVSGELELAKAGAYPTFVLRSGSVERLEGRAIPAGILQAVEVEPVRRRLLDGDVIVMATDGAAELGEAGESCLQHVLQTLGSARGEAAALADALSSCLEQVARGRWPDDVTVAVMTVRQLDAPLLPAYTDAGSGAGSRRPARPWVAVGRQRQRRCLVTTGAQPFGREGS